MKIILIVSCFVAFSISSIGQNLKINQAETYFKEFRYAEATPIYKELIEKNQINIDANESVYRHAVISSDKSHDFDFEYQVLAKLSQSSKYTFEDAFNYFQLSLFLGFHEKAKEILNSEIVKTNTDTRKLILDKYKGGAELDKIKSLDSSIYKIIKSEFNSGKGDFNAIYHPKGIAFTSARDLAFRKSTFDNSSYLNLYLYSKDSSVNELKFLETARHDGTAYYDSTNQVWYYSKNLPSKKAGLLTTTGLFIYDEKSKVEIPFPFNSVNFYLAQPSLSNDGKTLWFTSNREGGFGKSDIWYSVKSNTDWTEPINAGSSINTSENEMFPFYQNGKIYFSSNGHAGVGGLDIFSVSYKDGVTSDFKNLGTNLNSNGDDIALVLDKTEKNGFFSSNRENFTDNIYSIIITNLNFVFKATLVAEGTDIKSIQKIPVLVKKDDIVIDTLYADATGNIEFTGEKNSNYTFEINDNEFLPLTDNYSTVGKTESDTTYKTFDLTSKYVDVISNVFDTKTNSILPNTEVEIKNTITGEIIKQVSDKDGMINTKLLRNVEYEITAKKEGFEEHLSNLSTITKEKEIKAPIGLTVKMEIGSVLPMKRLNFDFAKSSLRKSDMLELDKVVLFMKANPTVVLEFSSYTDSRGNDNFNMELSRKRTETTLNYIKSKGIKKEFILGKWYGESQLVNECGNDSNCTEEQHQENRRTEIKIVSL